MHIPKIIAPARALEAHGDAIWRHYHRNVDGTREEFEERLLRDTHLMLFFGPGGAVVGMAGLRVLDLRHMGSRVRILYLHDLIVDESARGRHLAVWAASIAILRFTAAFQPTYIFGDCCNYRSYRAIVHHLEETWPAAGRAIPEREAALYDRLCRVLCGDAWNEATGLTSAVTSRHRAATPIPTSLLGKDPHVSFFLERNPGYLNGEGLPTLGRISVWSVLRALARPAIWPPSGAFPAPARSAA
jgi:hypothetical protein